jgi:hypothetical protein
MYSLFNSMPETLSAVVQMPGWSNLHSGLKRNLDTVIHYYRSHSMAVKSDHFLVTLLQTIDVPLSQNLERFHDNVQAMSLNLSMALKMTSSIYRGKIFDGVFYGPQCPEILIADNDDFDAEEAHKNWTNQVPVSVLRHPVTDLGLKLPDGHDNTTDFGVAVLVINIPLLAVMYRAFRLAEAYREEILQENQRSTMQFVHMYVLPNMMGSHLDYVLFNRIHALSVGSPLGEARRAHSFPLMDWTDKLNLAQERMLDFFANNARDFRGIMHEVPMVTKNNLDELMKLPDLAPTQQVVWALSISRLPALDFLFRVSKGGASIKNRQQVNYVLRQIKMYRRNSMMKVLPPDVLADVMFEIDHIEQQVADVNGM